MKRDDLLFEGALALSDRLGVLGRFRHYFISLRDADDFLDRRIAFRDPTPAILPQGFHTFGNGALLELAAIFLLHN